MLGPLVVGHWSERAPMLTFSYAHHARIWSFQCARAAGGAIVFFCPLRRNSRSEYLVI